MVFPSDREALTFALASLSAPTPAEQRLVWIPSTQHLSRIAISESLAQESSILHGWRLVRVGFEPTFDGEGNLVSPF